MTMKLLFASLVFLIVIPFAAAAGYQVSVTTSGDGHVSSYPPGILCGAACVESFDSGREITLTANPSAGAAFTGWSGACSGTATTCTFVLDSDKSVKATFSGVGGSAVKLRLTKQGDGIGSVFSDPDGIECSTICGSDSYSFTIDSTVKLTATPKTGSSFKEWGGDCSGTDKVCILKIDSAKSVTATFTASAPAPVSSYDLSVSKSGNGTGSITSGDGKINCGSDCSESYSSGTSVALKAVADEGSIFSGWSGDCKGDSACTLVMDSAKKATATFTKKPPQRSVQSLPVQQAGYEKEIVSGDASQPKPVAPQSKPKFKLNLVKKGGNSYLKVMQPSSYSCSDMCTFEFTEGAQVALSYEVGTNTKFKGWSGACSSMEKTCSITMNSDKAVSASFVIEEPDVTLLVFKSISTGKIESSPPGASCLENCPEASAKFKFGTVVTLTATPPKGFHFTRWDGQCDSVKGAQCTMKLDSPQEAAAALFYPSYEALVAEKDGSGPGAGTISSSDGKINCGPGCSGAQYPYRSGTAVTLTAQPTENSVFDGWSGACSGKGPCTLTVDSRKNVRANFSGKAPDKFKLSVSIQGSPGLITSADGNIACKTTCTEEYAKDSNVVLNALTESNSEFVGWSGACLGSAQSCSVKMAGDKSVSAIFRDKPPKVYKQLSVSPPGWGSVASSDGKVSCGPSCGGSYLSYLRDSKVILTATPKQGYVFSEWQGDCSGNSTTCTLIMNADRRIGTIFVPEPPKSHKLIVYKLPGKSSDLDLVTSNEGFISCGSACSVDVPTGKKIVLEAKPSAGRAFASWGMDCQNSANNQKCELIMDGPKTASATFTMAEVVVKKRNITASLSGPGTGKIIAEDYRIVCPPVCSALYDSNKEVKFEYENGPHSRLLRFEGSCHNIDEKGSVIQTYCRAMPSESDQAVAGVFVTTSGLEIAITKFSGAYGWIKATKSTGHSNTCQDSCSVIVESHESVSIRAGDSKSGDKHSFKGWFPGFGGCVGAATQCTLTLSVNSKIHAVFAPAASNVVMVSIGGEGSGKAYSASGNAIDCGSDCSEVGSGSFNLVAAPDIGFQFAGWKGDCSGTGPCAIDLGSASKFVTATFEKAPLRKLIVKKTGEGSTWLTSSQDGKVSCTAAECTYEFPHGTELKLAVSKLPARHRLKEWSGACSNAAATCDIKMDSDKAVTIVVEKIIPRRPGSFSCRGRPGCTTPVFG